MTPIDFICVQRSACQYKVTARHGETGDLIHMDHLDPVKDSARRKFARAVAVAASVSEEYVAAQLLRVFDQALARAADAASPGADLQPNEADADPTRLARLYF